jgi:NitT/TauT family transport system substrate-binding protein
VPLTVGLGYIPSVQFAQFYLAQQAGYYRAAGLDVTFQNKIDPDLVTLVGQGNVDIGVADGTSVIPAVSQGISIKYLATIYAQDPNVVVTKASTGIRTAADLKGRKVGIPGKYGSSWIMLQALLKSANLSPSDLQIVLYPDFGQAVALQQGAVDAATGFANNEPIQLELAGSTPVILRPDAASSLPGPGLISSTKTIATRATALRAFVSATTRAMRDIIADPNKGLDAAIATVPALGQDRATQLKILQATAAMWESDLTRAQGLGAVDRATWTRAIAFLVSLGLVAKPVTVDDVITSALLTT